MTKKTKPKAGARPTYSLEVRGVIACAFSALMFLSLISFSVHGNSAPNWLGAVGNTLGWSMTALLGLGSYLLSLFVGWIGVRWLFNKESQRPIQSAFFLFLVLASACILLSLFEDRYASVATTLRKAVYASVETRSTKYHLGGAPFFYIYHDLPKYNLLYVFNAPGVALLFTTTLLTSLLLLTNISPLSLLMRFVKMFDNFKMPSYEPTTSQQKPVKEVPVPIFTSQSHKEEETPPKEAAPVSDFMRYVKLRIPAMAGQATQPSTAGGEASSSTAEMMAIHPEQNLKSRPSLSRKEETDTKPDVIVESKKIAPPKKSRKKRRLLLLQKRRRQNNEKMLSLQPRRYITATSPPINCLLSTC